MNNSNNGFPKFRKVDKLNQPVVGLGVALVFYFIGIIVLYFIRNTYNPSISHLIKVFTSISNPFYLQEASKLLSLGLIGVLIPFYFFINTNRYLATRGVLILSLIGVAFILCYNFIL